MYNTRESKVRYSLLSHELSFRIKRQNTTEISLMSIAIGLPGRKLSDNECNLTIVKLCLLLACMWVTPRWLTSSEIWYMFSKFVHMEFEVCADYRRISGINMLQGVSLNW